MKKKPKKEHYCLIFVTNKTRSENPWMKEVLGLKKFVEESSPQVDTAIMDILGITKPLL